MNLRTSIIPTYKRTYLISETKVCILAQTNKKKQECIMINDGSIDCSNKISGVIKTII